MSNAIDATRQLTRNTLRLGWYWAVNRMLHREARRLSSPRPQFRPTGPVPTERELMVALGELLMTDARAVRDGLYPLMEEDALSPPEHLRRLGDMFRELPDTIARREAADAGTVRQSAGAAALPEYYAQDFHYQPGGYLSERSARLYDTQVETLFYGGAGAMRRAGLRPIAEAMRGRDQRHLSLLDVACGTGRFLRQARLTFPALHLSGLDLSEAYLEEARRHLQGLRPATLIAGNAEGIPLPDASQDFVTAIYLFHELPGGVRRCVAAEIARVLRPGGLFVMVDSVQYGDRPQWDGLLEAFPVRFHEPYFADYVRDDFDGMLTAAGLEAQSQSLAFLSKVLVRRRG
jgi:ubiquinone/menaquinone biosynthesis C-methylase UbiE